MISTAMMISHIAVHTVVVEVIAVLVKVKAKSIFQEYFVTIL